MSGLGKKILVFDDNQSIRTLLRFFFQKRNYDVRMEPDATDAVAVTKEYKPDLILMDVIMPGKDGFAAVAELRREGIATPIIMLTSKSFDDDKTRGLAAGATVYMLKPFNPKELEAAMLPLLG